MKPCLLSFVFLLLLTANVRAQSQASMYIGSTPCDESIRKAIKVPEGKGCVFIKWRLSLAGEKATAGNFEMEVWYGDDLPNTNVFKNGGTKIQVRGNYTVDAATKTNRPLYHLRSVQMNPELLLQKLDNNIFHFALSQDKLLKGNGGWGYVLNKTKEQ